MIEELIKEFGEKYRDLITMAIQFLDKEEPSWNLDTPIDRRKYIKTILSRVIT